MRLTLMTDYALRLLLFVAQHPDRLCTIAEVAQAHGISEAHLMKITSELARHGWLATVRGKGGGMRLAKPPAAIGLGAVVRSIEPDLAIAECFTPDSRCALTGHCRLAGVLGGALDRFLAHLDGHTLADLLPLPSPALLTASTRIAARRTP